MIAGTVYGVVLNDGAERAALAPAFAQAPYRAPPIAPVLYIKPHNTILPGGGDVMLDGLAEIAVAPAIGLILGRDATRVRPGDALDTIAAAALALDLSEPCDSYYRPTVRQRCRDGFLPVGTPVPFDPALLETEIVTRIDGVEAHRWSPARLIRDAASLIADVSAFMTLEAGDMLLIGVPHDAPVARRGQRIETDATGFASVRATLEGNA
jgi:5-oxopent-3-ene-1,2,5-tricarboxylate decarboxylase/2-hydroxyhepta-2,4-diene-1,7-dioate isomerase